MNITEFKGQRIYLASPYSHEDGSIEQARHEHTLSSTARLIELGLFVFSPIVYCRELAREFSLPGDFDYWKAFNWTWITWSDQLWIDLQPGWDESVGIQHELVFADAQKKPVLLYNQEEQTLKEIE